jgi:serine/threonine protein phosphatase 1
MDGGDGGEMNVAPGARVPDGRRIYAIGDIHGRHDLLVRLHEMILDDAAQAPAESLAVVYLGDYVDRGAASFEVVDALIHDRLPGFEHVFLKGNHEAMMLQFLAGGPASSWMFNGGIATLASYGVLGGRGFSIGLDLDDLRRSLLAAVPPAHLQFLKELQLHHVEGDYLFVHAGIEPSRPWYDQAEEVVLWVRAPFLRCTDWLGKRVVHGHSITAEPEIWPNRIGIDTGAYNSDRLTCVVLEDARVRFLQTSTALMAADDEEL